MYKPHKRRTPDFHVVDSDTGETFPGHRRFAVAYDPFWQMIRLKLRWATYEDAVDSTAICDAYVKGSPKEDLQNRVWRVYNLLCSIPHGQSSKIGIRIIERSVTQILMPYMASYKVKMTEIGMPTEWDWAVVRHKITVMEKADIDVLWDTTEHLLKNRSQRSDPKLELRYYLRICLDAMGIEEPYEQQRREKVKND